MIDVTVSVGNIPSVDIEIVSGENLSLGDLLMKIVDEGAVTSETEFELFTGNTITFDIDGSVIIRIKFCVRQRQILNIQIKDSQN